MLQRFLDPATLASISSLDLVAKTVVDGFVAGMHRSPDFGFSQEFAEYRAYSEGDDLRHVDWNVFARTDKCFLKRYRGETNSQLLLLLDTSASMGYGSQPVHKLDYSRFVAASLCYMASLQRDAAGLIIFDEDVKNYVQPSTRQGQLFRLLHAIEKAEVGTHTDFSKPFVHFQNFLHRRGIVVVMSDFYEDPATIITTVEPLRYKGNEVILFHILDPQEIKPKFRDPVLLYDVENTVNSLEVSPEYARNEYRKRIDGHIEALSSKARSAGLDYFLMDTSRPLDEGLREYLRFAGDDSNAMGFLTPWFLAGAAAVGLPVWLHLLRKHKTTPLPFSSLMFFEKRTQSSIKHRRLRYLLLFALRALLVLLLVLAFAHPFIRRQVLGGQRANEVTVLAIDNSLSMRAGTKLSQAKNAAKSVIDGLRTGQKAQVLAFGSRVQVMSEVTDDHNSLKAAVDAVEPGDARTSFGELSRSVRSIAASLKLPMAVELYSDMQQSGWPSNFNDLRLSSEVRLNPHGIEASQQQPNFAVENVIAPRRVYDAKKTRVLVTVAGYGTEKATRTVSLVLNGRTVESKQAEVPESGRAVVEFLSLEVPYGRNKGEVRIDSADTLAADDTFYFSVERADPKKALFVQESVGSAGLLYFKAALDAAGQSAFEIDPVTVEQSANLNPSKYAFVVLNDLGAVPGTLESALREYVRGGGSVLITLGVKSAQRTKVPVTGETIQGGKYSGREGERFQAVAFLDASHPSILKDDRWEDVKFYYTVHVNPSVSRVAAKLSDQTPLLLDQQIGEGHVVVFASTFDKIENDFPIHASFVPFIDQTSRYLGRVDAGPASVPVGAYAELRDTKEKGSAVDVVDPKGERALSLDEATKAQNIQYTMAGFYDIRRPNGRNELVAVNADRRESDLTPVAQESLTLWQNTATGVANAGTGTTDENNKPVSLWWYVMIIVLLLAVAESLLGNQHLSVDKEAA